MHAHALNLHVSEETHKWPHTRTLRMTSAQIRNLLDWLHANHIHHVHVDVHKRAYTAQTQQYAVVIYCRDLDAWPTIVITWC